MEFPIVKVTLCFEFAKIYVFDLNIKKHESKVIYCKVAIRKDLMITANWILRNEKYYSLNPTIHN